MEVFAMANSKTMDLTHGSVPKQLLKFSVPFLLANLMQTVYSMVDMVIVGQFVGSEGLSGISTSSMVTMLFTTVGMGLVMGSQMMIAQFKGAGDEQAQRETIGTTMTFMLILALIMTIPSILCVRPLLHLLNTPDEAFEHARSYLVICLAGTIFIYGYNGVCTVLRGLGDSTRPMIFVAISTVVNIILDLVFVGPLNMGTAGAAAATIIAQAVSFIISSAYLYSIRHNFVFDFKLRSFRIVGSRLKMILKIGVPFAIQFSIINISMLFIISLVNSYGVAASAAYGVGGKVDTFATMPLIAIGSAASTMVGQNMGAGLKDRAKSVINWSLVITCCFAVVIIAIVQLIPGFLVSLFDRDEEVIRIGTMYIRFVSISYIAHALMTSYEAMANGIGFSMLTLACCLFDGVCLRISLAYLFALVLGMGISGVFLGAMCAPFGAAFISGVYFYSGKWKTRKLAN
jgi:putative MATE family efflux protein